MADPKSPAGGGDVPRFPPPRRPEEPSPYRKGAPAANDAPAPVKRLVVSRPEPPPEPSKPRAPAPAPRSPPMAIPGVQREPRVPRTLLRLFADHPRSVAALWTLFCAFAFGSVAVNDAHARHAAILLGRDWAYVTRPHYYQLFAVAAAVGLWVVIASVPIDDTTGRPKDWWYFGLAFSGIGAFAEWDKLAGLVVRLFA